MGGPERFLVRPGTDLTGPGAWPEVFGRPGLLEVEIGFGKDEFLLERAGRRPEGCFLAVDFSRPRSRSYLNKIATRKLENVRVLLEHAEAAIGYCLPEASVEEVFVLFPDPWPKKRHAANRLVRPWFAREMDRVLVPRGRVTLASDHAPYREQMLDVMEGHGAFRNLLGPRAAGPRPEEWGATIFERRWVGKGREVAYLRFEKEGCR